MPAADSMPGMDLIKERITQVLDDKGVLTRLKAELRANVFLAINDQDIKQGGVGLSSKTDGIRREELLADPAGVLVVELVRELLRWCNLHFTLKVFDPEMQLPSAALDRSNLAQQLGLDGAGPLLLQLLNQHLQQVTQHGPIFAATREALAAPAAAAAVAGVPPASLTAAGALSYNLQQQQQPAAAAGALPPFAAMSKVVVHGAPDVTAVKQASKSALTVEDTDLDEEVISTQLTYEDDEEYAAVFLAGQGHSAGSAHGSEDSSGSHTTPQQQQQPPRPRPVCGMQGISSAAHEQASASAEAAPNFAHSFGDLDRSPATLSLDGLDSPPERAAPSHPTPAAVAAGGGGPGSPDNIPGVGSFISPASSFMDMQPQKQVAPPPAAAVAPGWLAPPESLGPLRPNKLAPLGPVKGPGLVGVSSSNGSNPARAPGSEDLKEELRRVGLIGSNSSSPGASITTSPQGQSAQYALQYSHELDSPGSLGAAGDAQQHAVAAGSYASQGQGPGMAEPVAAAAAGRAVYGSVLGRATSIEDDSDDFELSTRELFAAARRQLSQSGHSQQQQVFQQQQQSTVQAGGATVIGPKPDDGGSVAGSGDTIDDIPEDFSGDLPIEGSEEGDLSAVYTTGVAVTGTHATAAEALDAADQLGMSMEMHETGLSLSDRLGGIAGLTSADLLDEDDF